MTLAVVIAQDVVAAAFVALGLAIAYRWYRYRVPAQGKLAVALMALAVVAAAGRLPQSTALSLVAVVALMVSAYFVLLFRDDFISLTRTAHWLGGAIFAIGVALGVLLVTALVHTTPAVMTAVSFLYVVAWSLLIGEPVLRFWLASNRLPAVQKARMRYLSAGFAVLIAILLVDVLGGSALRSPTAVFITQVIALGTVPLIYFSFAPPSLLRRIWRMSEENALRNAMQDLLIFSPTRKELADRAVFWAVRMLGGTRGFVLDPKGDVIAGEHDESGGAVIRAPLHLPEGEGTLGVVAGRFTPLFGSDEISQLRAYANSVSAGLQRVSVTERMAALERTKSQFLNLASHELRGPVTVIRGYVSMLEAGMLGELNERGRKAAGTMSAKVSEMNQIIEEMIESARLEEGGITLRPAEIDLRDVARQASEAVTPMLGPNHRLELDLPDRRVRVKVDVDRTRTIVTNLLSNAIKYSPEGGVIACQVRARGGFARLSVTDEGVGISRENMPVLFTRFGRVVTPQTQHLKGTGLGLFLARQLARLQGGDITVMSTEGTGSTFTLQLPVETHAAAETADLDLVEGAEPAREAAGH